MSNRISGDTKKQILFEKKNCRRYMAPVDCGDWAVGSHRHPRNVLKGPSSSLQKPESGKSM